MKTETLPTEEFISIIENIREQASEEMKKEKRGSY